jgi:Skp family chaperone for outer membrane proteins
MTERSGRAGEGWNRGEYSPVPYLPVSERSFGMFGKNFTISFAAAALALTAFLAPSLSAAELKVGYIRPQYIFSKYEPYKEAQKQVDTYRKTELEKLQKMSDDFQKKAKDMDTKSLLMTEEILKVKREELQKQREQIDASYNELYKAGGKLESKQKELLNPILDRINGTLMRIGKDENYDFILDAEGPVLYANPKFDISDYVLKELDKEAPKK